MKTTLLNLVFAIGSVLADAPRANSQFPKTLFLDDFKGASGASPNTNNWIISTGTSYPGGPAQWGTGEVQTYTNSGNNVRQAGNSELLITPIKGRNGVWTSARLETRRADFKAPAGRKLRVEARIKIPSVSGSNGAGYWPAFWALGSGHRTNRTNWPAVGELDIMENVNGQDTFVNVMHCDKNPGGVCNEPNGLGATANCRGSRCPGNYHIYEMIIDRSVKPERINFFIDRTFHRSILSTAVGQTVWDQAVNSGFSLIINVAMGGSFPNAIAGQSTPTSSTVSGRAMSVDYVAVWSS